MAKRPGQLYAVMLSDMDQALIQEIIDNVPGVRTPQQAISWALRHAQIPKRKTAHSPLGGAASPSSKGGSRIVKLILGKRRTIQAPRQRRAPTAYEIELKSLESVLQSITIDAKAVRQLSSSSAEFGAITVREKPKRSE